MRQLPSLAPQARRIEESRPLGMLVQGGCRACYQVLETGAAWHKQAKVIEAASGIKGGCMVAVQCWNARAQQQERE